jgi:uncharacterized protein (DUF952 family)
MQETIIYHLVKPQYWNTQKENAAYFSETFNEETFIHASTKAQLNATANRYYKNETTVVLLEIDTNLLISELKYEYSPSVQQDFPHIYGGINKEAIVKIDLLEKNIDDNWSF